VDLVNESRRPVVRYSVALAFVVTTMNICSPATAQSNVTLSGLIDVEVNSQILESTGQRVTNLNGASNGPNGGLQNSYFQIAGDELVGDGISAGFALCSYFQPGTGELGRFFGDTSYSCSANLHAAGDFGTLTVGVQENPLYQAMVLFDPFNGSFGYSPIIQQTYYAFVAGNVLSADTGYSNAVGYNSPELNGIGTNVLYSLSGESRTKGSFSGNVIVSRDRLGAAIAIESSTVTDQSNNTFILGGKYAPGTTQKIILGGASYDFEPVKVFGSYEHDVTTTPGANAVGANTVQLGSLATFGRHQFLASIARTAGSLDHRTWATGYVDNLSRYTEIYVAYLRDSAQTFAHRIGSMGVGVVHRF
jgi:predicted porin